MPAVLVIGRVGLRAWRQQWTMKHRHAVHRPADLDDVPGVVRRRRPAEPALQNFIRLLTGSNPSLSAPSSKKSNNKCNHSDVYNNQHNHSLTVGTLQHRGPLALPNWS